MKRILIGGIAGGLVMFIWGAISHMALPLGTMGLSTLSNEDAVLGVMKSSIPEPGLYFFPGMDLSRKATAVEEAAWRAKYVDGPTGLLLYHPQGSQPMSPRQLLVEALSDIAAALAGAFILARLAGGLGLRTLIMGLLGLVAWLSISVSYWDWYGFPCAFTVAEGIDQVVGWLFSGVAMAMVVKPPQG